MNAVMVSAWMSASRVHNCSTSCSALASACCMRWSAAPDLRVGCATGLCFCSVNLPWVPFPVTVSFMCESCVVVRLRVLLWRVPAACAELLR